MHRTIEHTAFARRSFVDICHILERDGAGVLERATDTASQHSTMLVNNAEQDLSQFDSSETLAVRFDPLTRDDDHHAWLEFTWSANREKRLLANVEARLDIGPLVRTGPAATTELILRAQYEPAPGSRRSPETVLFGRRVVKAALHRLLQEMVGYLEEYEESNLT